MSLTAKRCNGPRNKGLISDSRITRENSCKAWCDPAAAGTNGDTLIALRGLMKADVTPACSQPLSFIQIITSSKVSFALHCNF